MLKQNLGLYSVYRVVGKWSAIVFSSVILLVGAVSRLELVNLLWAAAPLFFLGLLDAGYLARERRCLEQLRAGKNADDLLPLASAVEEIAGFLRALSALSIWPFYLGLVGIVFAGGRVLPPAVRVPASSGLQESGLTGLPPGPGQMARPNPPGLGYPPASPRPGQFPGIPPRPMIRQTNPPAPGQTNPLPSGPSALSPVGPAGAAPQHPSTTPGVPPAVSGVPRTAPSISPTAPSTLAPLVPPPTAGGPATGRRGAGQSPLQWAAERDSAPPDCSSHLTCQPELIYGHETI